ncbi:MAG: hypothetical protein HMLKMBBP_03154 [Planctomycetes bacterium]|nr:hypothetical protein [Planctomycetota bacterium]
MSGTVGTFTTSGAKIDEKTARNAVEAAGLTFEKMEVAERAAAAAVWSVGFTDAPT